MVWGVRERRAEPKGNEKLITMLFMEKLVIKNVNYMTGFYFFTIHGLMKRETSLFFVCRWFFCLSKENCCLTVEKYNGKSFQFIFLLLNTNHPKNLKPLTPSSSSLFIGRQAERNTERKVIWFYYMIMIILIFLFSYDFQQKWMVL